ncbi:MAG TPA: response regulator [Verrucomicrobiae bacterium]|nr:response regulator [Verrucomicrobiae bacterium]
MNQCNEIEIENEIETEITDVGSRSSIPAGRLNGSEAGPIRIWLVDDNAPLRALLENLLNGEAGFECARQFSSPTAVLNALSTEVPPDVILLDVQMGAENGLDAIGPIKLLASNTHVLMLTTIGHPEIRERAFREGASDFLLKSWQFDEMAKRIRRAMEFGPVAGLLTTFLDRQALAEVYEERPKTVAVRTSTAADRWFSYLRSWLRFSPS